MQIISHKTLLSCFLLIILLSGCGNPAPRQELQNLPSLIQVIRLDFSDNLVRLRVSHRNRTPREGNQLSCQLAIRDQPAIQANAVNLPDLTTYATETITLPMNLTQLDIDHDRVTELPYVLDCHLFSSNFRKEHVITRASLYPVPGSKNSYR
jgi:hypothetical protein